MNVETSCRAACYVRVSTENQVENYSIDEQIKRTQSYCAAKGWNVYNVYPDGGYSGGNVNRPALQQMLEDMRQRKFDVIVVYKLDRLSRSQKDTLMLVEDCFSKFKVDFVSVTENLDTTTSLGKAMIGILSVFAQLEKDQITERFTMGRIARSKAGKYHGGLPAPTGYIYTNDTLIVDEFKAIQVREVFDKFLSGQSVNSIRAEMSEKYGGWPGHSSVLNALRNTVYIGKVKFAGEEYDGEHEPIIRAEIFCKANMLLNNRANSHTTAQKTPFRASQLLTSLVYCGKCGAKYSSAHGRYKCYSRSKVDKRFITNPTCKNKHWSLDLLDSLIIENIKTLRHNPEHVDEIFKNKQEQPTVDDATIKKRLKAIKGEKSRLMDLYQINEIPIEDIKGRMGTLQQEEDTLGNQLSKNEIPTTTRNNFESVLRGVESILQGNSLDEKRLFVSSLIEKIILDDEHVQINWRI
jgi:site-specific DNA recombinase